MGYKITASAAFDRDVYDSLETYVKKTRKTRSEVINEAVKRMCANINPKDIETGVLDINQVIKYPCTICGKERVLREGNTCFDCKRIELEKQEKEEEKVLSAVDNMIITKNEQKIIETNQRREEIESRLRQKKEILEKAINEKEDTIPMMGEQGYNEWVKKLKTTIEELQKELDVINLAQPDKEAT